MSSCRCYTALACRGALAFSEASVWRRRDPLNVKAVMTCATGSVAGTAERGVLIISPPLHWHPEYSETVVAVPTCPQSTIDAGADERQGVTIAQDLHVSDVLTGHGGLTTGTNWWHDYFLQAKMATLVWVRVTNTDGTSN